MTATRHKLDEARFFLRKVDEYYYHDLPSVVLGREPPEFRYYLSAFLSAARSITWIMRSEFGALEGWDAWFKSNEPGDAEKQLLKVFNELRVRTEKVGPVRPTVRIWTEDMAGPDVKWNPNMTRFRMTIMAADEPNVQPVLSKTVVAYEWTLSELDGIELIKACRQYIDGVAALLDECEIRFARP